MSHPEGPMQWCLSTLNVLQPGWSLSECIQTVNTKFSDVFFCILSSQNAKPCQHPIMDVHVFLEGHPKDGFFKTMSVAFYYNDGGNVCFGAKDLKVKDLQSVFMICFVPGVNRTFGWCTLHASLNVENRLHVLLKPDTPWPLDRK